MVAVTLAPGQGNFRAYLGTKRHERERKGTKGHKKERKGTNGNNRARMGTFGYGLGNYLRRDHEGDTGGLGRDPQGSRESKVRSHKTGMMELGYKRVQRFKGSKVQKFQRFKRFQRFQRFFRIEGYMIYSNSFICDHPFYLCYQRSIFLEHG